jgi:hypothetical protein
LSEEKHELTKKLLWCVFSDIVMELITSGNVNNVIEAIYIAHEADLLERFPPAPLLKSYLQDSSDKAQAVLKSGRYSSSAVVRIFSSRSIQFSVICVGSLFLS